MCIRKGVSPTIFLRAVNACKGQVWFCTKEQDQLNLKSVLSQCIFATLTDSDIMKNAWIVCENRDDELELNAYLE